MENKSSQNPQRRRRGSRSGGRSRSRQGSSDGQNRSSRGPSSESSGGRNNNRSRSGNRSRRVAPKPSLFQRILSAVTFGLLGKKASGKRKSSTRPQKQVQTSNRQRNPDTREPRPQREAASADLTQRRKASTTEVTTPRLYVGNLDFAATEGELEDLFRGVGLVTSTEVVINPRTQQSKGFAFVVMGSVEEALRAVAVLDNQDFMGRRLIVGGARSDGPKDGSSNDGAASLEVAAD